MIDGYDSVMTLSTALAAVFLLWIIPALGLMAIGALGLASGGTQVATDESIDSFNSAFGMAQGAQSLMGLLTGTLFVYWAFRARENVRRLGKRHRIGVADIFIRRLKALAVAFLALIVVFFVPIPSVQILGLIIFAGAFIYISFFVHSVTYATMQMLWRTSSPPVGLENAMPHVGLVWFWSWALYAITTGLSQNPAQQSDVVLTINQLSVIAIFQGVMLLIAVAAAARLVMGVAIRQEERLGVIMSYVDNDAPGDDTSSVVTTDQIQSAWDDSDRFISFNA